MATSLKDKLLILGQQKLTAQDHDPAYTTSAAVTDLAREGTQFLCHQ